MDEPPRSAWFDAVEPPTLPAYPPGLYSRAVRIPIGERSLLITSGHLARDPVTHKIVGQNDAAAQAEWVLEQLNIVLREAGGSLRSIVSMKIYYTDVSDVAKIIDVRKRHFTQPPYPTVTGVLCKLAVDDALVEMDAIAVV
jgi:2-iminobutanoate/2-iminopropanoate deaminase